MTVSIFALSPSRIGKGLPIGRHILPASQSERVSRRIRERQEEFARILLLKSNAPADVHEHEPEGAAQGTSTVLIEVRALIAA